MANSHRSKVKCVSVDYTYPVQITAMWRATANCGKYVDVVVSSDVPREIVPYIVRRIISDPSTFEYQEIICKLDVKPNNVQRFLASAVQELVDALHENVVMERINIVYDDGRLFFTWVAKNVDTGYTSTIKFEGNPGEEITMEQFLKENKGLTRKELNFTKRDIRKMFVIIKKIIKLFPRVLNKNTPLRGLYLSK